VSGTYELLEHTADVGIRATGERLEDVFAAAGRALVELQDAWAPGQGDPREVEVEADDREALLVAWLDEVLYLQETRDQVLGEIAVTRVGEHHLSATVRAAPRAGRDLEGVGVKAATFHRLRLEETPRGWVAEVYLDV
jgi:SHS2 domain-containing protein